MNSPGMAEYDFDSEIDRRHSRSFKWDGSERLFGGTDLIPFWVADMDFATPTPVREAISRRLLHPVFGYEERDDEYVDTVLQWLNRRHAWQVPREWLRFCPPSTIVAMHGIIDRSTPGDCSIVAVTPTYGPLLKLVENSGRRLLRCPLQAAETRFELDLDRLRGCIEGDTAMIIVCSPNNPTGRVFESWELQGMVEIAGEHDLILLSDEVHADLVRPGFTHLPLGKCGYGRSVTVMSPNKTFNTAGLPQASLIIPDAQLREEFSRYVDTLQVNHDSTFGSVAMMAAYRHCEAWLEALNRYLDGNHRLLEEAVSSGVRGLRVWPAEATYLAWLDYREMKLDEAEVQHRLIHRGRVALYNGSIFGHEGRGFLRMNVACPREVLRRGVEGLQRAFAD